MKLIDEEIILHLKKWDGKSSDFKGNKIITGLDRKIIGYYDSKNLLHLLIESEDKDFTEIIRKGMTVTFRNVPLQNEDHFSALDFVCNSIGFDKYFLKIVNEIIEKSVKENIIEKTTPQVIENWFHFLELPKKSKLSFHELVGLIGELKSIEQFHLHGIDPVKLLKCWTGPSGGRRDFIFGGNEIEVKTSASQGGHIHRINGIDQLSHSENESIYLYSWNILKDVSEKAFTINALIENIERNIFKGPALAVKFHEALYSLGYDIRDAQEYKNDRFRVIENMLCEVDEDFPRITRGSFEAPVDNRIVKIEYDIDLNGFKKTNLNSFLNEI